MADLSSLDITAPAATTAVSDGDDRIRETREAVVTSFGGTDAGVGAPAPEHYLRGAHKLPHGAPGARPVVGHAGRVFFDTTNDRIELDDGSAWNHVHAVAVREGMSATVGALQTAETTVQSVAVDIGVGSHLLVQGSFRLVGSLSGVIYYGIKLNGIGNFLDPGEMAWDVATGAYYTTVPFAAFMATPPAGPTTVTLRMRIVGGAILMDYRMLVVQVL